MSVKECYRVEFQGKVYIALIKTFWEELGDGENGPDLDVPTISLSCLRDATTGKIVPEPRLPADVAPWGEEVFKQGDPWDEAMTEVWKKNTPVFTY